MADNGLAGLFVNIFIKVYTKLQVIFICEYLQQQRIIINGDAYIRPVIHITTN